MVYKIDVYVFIYVNGLNIHYNIFIIMNIDKFNYLIELRKSLELNKYIFKNENEKFLIIVNDLLKEIDNILKSECVHDYIEDYIDINQETTQKINYCAKCMCSFHIK